MIGILDYGAGNVRSVENALFRIGAAFFVSDNPKELEKADKILFPGVGHAASAMQILREKKLDQFLQTTKKPVLGICLGMQLLFEFSEESNGVCLGIISGRVQKFDTHKVPQIPHTGWNEVEFNSPHPPLFKEGEDSAPYGKGRLGGVNRNADFYFVHSYYCVPKNLEEILAETEYNGFRFCSAVKKENFLGVQFHPEKSGKAGEEILEFFLKSYEP